VSKLITTKTNSKEKWLEDFKRISTLSPLFILSNMMMINSSLLIASLTPILIYKMTLVKLKKKETVKTSFIEVHLQELSLVTDVSI